MNSHPRSRAFGVIATSLGCLMLLAACQPKGQAMDDEELTAFATRYAQAWSSQDPALFASFYAEDGSLAVNDGKPSVGRAAIEQTAREYMTAFPDMAVSLVEVERQGGQVIFRWRWTGTNTGPGGTGSAVDLTGFEQWTLSAGGLIQQSLGHLDEAEYQRQLHAGSQAIDCDASGDYAFVCGLKSAEDLVHLPGTKWIVASSMVAGGSLYLVDAQRKTWTALYPGDAPRTQHDKETYGACPGAPAAGSLVSHGLNLRPGSEGQSTLYVVGHGGREAVEVFDVDASGDAPVLTWRGCIPTPDAMEANSVSSLADGSLLVTIPLHKGVAINVALAGKPTGGVYRWSPGGAGMTMVPGTELPYANGIEVSADGKEFYVASSGLLTVTAYSNTDPARVLRRTGPLSFVPDNLHWGPDGKLLTAGLNVADEACGNVKQSEEFSLEEFASCPRAFTVVGVDPQSMEADVVATGPANPRFSNITMALPVGGELWIGTFAGDRIAYRPLASAD